MLPKFERIVCLFIFVAFVTTSFCRVGQSQNESRKIIVCSSTQVADFTRQVVGDHCEVHCILAPGTDPHLYETTPGDATLVASSDLCIENGWNLEGKDWMRRLARSTQKKIATCVDNVEPLELEEGAEKVRDPHAWMSPKNAAMYVRNILRAVSELDPQHAKDYENRARLYLDQLRTLDHWIVGQVSRIPQEERVLVTSHDAFNYFCRDYGFKSASPTGWSTGDEVGGGATERRRDSVVGAIRGQRVKAVFSETTISEKLIRTIADGSGIRLGGKLYSDSMGPPGSAGESYIGMIRENVLTIVEGLAPEP